MIQRPLNLPVSERTVLVDVNMVRAARGVDADTVTAWVDSGELVWVWNVSTNPGGEIRELRFWAGEIICQDKVRALSLNHVVNALLPAREWFRGTEVSHLLLVSRPTVWFLRTELKAVLIGHTLKVKRMELVAFFKRRWVGQVRKPQLQEVA
jgi:hypothetical protein